MVLKFILLFLAGMLTVSAYESYRDRTLFMLWTAIRPRHVLRAIIYLVLVIATMLLLSQIPYLDWGYIKALTEQNESVYTAAMTTPPSTTDTVEKILPAWIALALVLNLPAGVMAEERYFRGNVEHWSGLRRFSMQLGFGLIHMILGIPVFAALAIAVLGLLLTARRMKLVRMGLDSQEIFLDGSAIHLAYNLLIIVPLVIIVLSKI